MTHLAIAKGISDNNNIVTNLPLFYLGSISPDCVHVRNEYNSNMKKLSHFCSEDKPWGEIDNNNEWRKDVILALKSYQDRDDFDFYLGYFTHILADIYDNETIYKTFKEKYSQENQPLQDRGKAFYNDKSQNDFELYRLSEWKDEVWNFLRQSDGGDIPDIITSCEVQRYKDLVLHQYDEGKSQYDQPIKYFSLSDNLFFIENSINKITSIIANLLKEESEYKVVI